MENRRQHKTQFQSIDNGVHKQIEQRANERPTDRANERTSNRDGTFNSNEVSLLAQIELIRIVTERKSKIKPLHGYFAEALRHSTVN